MSTPPLYIGTLIKQCWRESHPQIHMFERSISTTEPRIFAKEPYIFAEEPCISASPTYLQKSAKCPDMKASLTWPILLDVKSLLLARMGRVIMTRHFWHDEHSRLFCFCMTNHFRHDSHECATRLTVTHSFAIWRTHTCDVTHTYVRRGSSSPIWSSYYGVATVSRIDKIIGLFCRISSLL